MLESEQFELKLKGEKMSFISTELNLDRDVPDGEILVESSDKPVVVDYLVALEV